MKRTACSTVAAANTTKRGIALATMNCVPTQPDDITHDRIREPANPDDPAGERILRKPRDRSRQESGRRAHGQGEVDDDHQHEVERGGAADEHLSDRRLQHQRKRNGCRGTGNLHRVPPAGVAAASSAAAAGGVRTTRTCSRLAKSTAGRTRIVP